MAEKRVGIIMHGVTGRMGMNQHLIRSILEIRKQGGVALKDGTRVMPDPHKDIGLNILSQFHYGANVKIATFETLADALQNICSEVDSPSG